MENSVINTQQIIDLLTRNLTIILQNDEEYYKDTKIVIREERQFVRKTQDYSNGTIFIVVKILPATLNFGKITLPFVLTAVSERNSIEKCSRLLNNFAMVFNMCWDESKTIRQFYTSPTILNAFNDVANGFRSTMYINGTYVISKDSNPAEVFLDDETEPLPIIFFSDSCDIQGDRQVFYDTNDFSKSVSMVGTYQIEMRMYLTDTPFFNKILKIKFGQGDINSTFNLTVKYKNGITSGKLPMKLVNVTVTNPVEDNPVIAMSFTL